MANTPNSFPDFDVPDQIGDLQINSAIYEIDNQSNQYYVWSILSSVINFANNFSMSFHPLIKEEMQESKLLIRVTTFILTTTFI